MQNGTHQNISSPQDTSALEIVGIGTVLDEFEKALRKEVEFRLIGKYCNVSVSRVLATPMNEGSVGTVVARLEYSPENIIASKLEADEFSDAADLVRKSVGDRGIAINIRINYEGLLAHYKEPDAAGSVCRRMLIGLINIADSRLNPVDMTGLSG